MKILKLSGMVLLVAGLSIATSSCSKKALEASQNADEVIVAPVVDFSESTKAPDQVLAVSSDSVKVAVEEIVNSLAKEFEKDGKSHEDALDSLHVCLFRTLTSFCDYHRFDKFSFKNKIGLYKAWYKLLIGKKDEYSYVHLFCKNRQLSLETTTGYYIRIDLPAWVACLFEKDGEFDYKAHNGDEYVFEVGKNDRIYVQKIVDTKKNSALTFVYDANQVAVAGSCWVKDGVDYLWYNNAQVAGEHPTSIRIYDVELLNKDLAMMKSEFIYTQEEAKSIVDEFNSIVTIDAISPLCASLCGKDFKAVVDGPTQAGFYRAILKWGDQFVPAQEVKVFVEKWFKRVLKEEM